MNKQQRAPEYRVGIGASSILMIFIVLSLTTLAVLSFASARADLALTERRQTQVTAYYGALAESETLLADIDAALFGAQQGEADAYDAAVDALPSLDSRITITRDRLVAIRIPVGTTQELRLELEPAGMEGESRYTINAQYLVNVEEWEPDTSSGIYLGDPEDIVMFEPQG